MRTPGIVLPVSVSLNLTILTFYISPASLPEKKGMAPPRQTARIFEVATGSAILEGGLDSIFQLLNLFFFVFVRSLFQQGVRSLDHLVRLVAHRPELLRITAVPAVEEACSLQKLIACEQREIQAADFSGAGSQRVSSRRPIP